MGFQRQILVENDTAAEEVLVVEHDANVVHEFKQSFGAANSRPLRTTCRKPSVPAKGASLPLASLAGDCERQRGPFLLGAAERLTAGENKERSYMKPIARKIRPKQQEIERHYFEQFQNKYPLPAGRVEYGDKPDVTVTGNRKLGIEITNFYLEEGASTSSEQVQSKWRESAVSRARTLYMQNAGKNVVFKFGVDKAHPIQDVKAVAKEIASEILCAVMGHKARSQLRSKILWMGLPLNTSPAINC
jgi:hypothetical protein